MLIELLIEDRMIGREELLLLLARAERASTDRRSTVFAGLRLLVERGFT